MPPRRSGPRVVLVHGLVISSLYIVPTAERLAAHFPVYAPDLPGFGPPAVVRGSRDPIVPQRRAGEVAGLLPRARLEVIPGGPHVVNYTTPGPFEELVRGFLEEGVRP